MEQQNIIYCKIGWAKSYCGDADDKPQGAGSYNKDPKNTGFETYNFKEHGGKYYGYVRVRKGASIRIDKHFDCARNADYADNVLVMWVSRNPKTGKTVVAGWCKNARVYRNYQAVPSSAMAERGNKDINKYNIEARKECCRLLDESERNVEIEGMGQTNYWYGSDEANKKVMALIAE